MDITSTTPGEAEVTARRSLADLRAELNLKQSQLAQEAQVGTMTVSVAERKMRVREVSAYKIFHAINRLRTKAGLPPIAFDEIAWT